MHSRFLLPSNSKKLTSRISRADSLEGNVSFLAKVLAILPTLASHQTAQLSLCCCHEQLKRQLRFFLLQTGRESTLQLAPAPNPLPGIAQTLRTWPPAPPPLQVSPPLPSSSAAPEGKEAAWRFIETDSSTETNYAASSFYGRTSRSQFSF